MSRIDDSRLSRRSWRTNRGAVSDAHGSRGLRFAVCAVTSVPPCRTNGFRASYECCVARARRRRLVRFENVQELMKQYKKPLLQSAFDLQSRLANQLRSNFLNQFANKGNFRDAQYARLNMAFGEP